MSEAEQTAAPDKDYERTARLIREKFAALGIVAQFSAPEGKVSDSTHARSFGPPRVGWAHVNFRVTFSTSRRDFTTEYNIGTGLAPWKHSKVKSAARLSWGPFGSRTSGGGFFIARRECFGEKANRYAPHIEAEAAALACKIAKWNPDPAEIFAGVCREGFESRDVTFEDWAECFGYDPDSREGERVFNACRANWANVLRLVSAADAEEFAVLAGEL